MKIIATLLTATLLLTGCNVSFNSGSQQAGKSEPGTEAQQKLVANAADAFLRQLDSGDIDGTWSQSSPYLQQLSSRAVWSAGIGAFRKTVGPFKSRKLKGIGFTHEVDGVPRGNYAAVAFDTTFSGATVEEKVVLHEDKGDWKVLGYFMSKSFKGQL
jgi:hypothetical protein